MPATGFPGGITSGGAPIGGPGPFTGGRVFYVGNRSGLPAGTGADAGHPVSTINGALAKCRANNGDVIYVMPGHAENVASADAWSSLVAGTKIIGLGRGTERPTFTWSTAASTVLLDQANVTLENVILKMAGPAGSTALTVTAPMTISAAGVTLRNIQAEIGIDADQKVTDAITTTAAADDLTIEGCEIYGDAAAEVTSVLKFVGADRLKLLSSTIRGAAATDTTGIILFATTASTNMVLQDLNVHANGTGNQTCIDMAANIACTGFIDYVLCRNMTDANTNWIVTSGTGVDITFGNNVYGVNNTNERGKQIGTASV